MFSVCSIQFKLKRFKTKDVYLFKRINCIKKQCLGCHPYIWPAGGAHPVVCEIHNSVFGKNVSGFY